MIVKKGEEYHVMSKDGKKCLGKYSTKSEAEKRLKQVEYYKHYTEHKEHEAKESKAQEKAEHKK